MSNRTVLKKIGTTRECTLPITSGTHNEERGTRETNTYLMKAREAVRNIE